jgi:dihydrofolate synthase/folylpolyglutamate synthase
MTEVCAYLDSLDVSAIKLGLDRINALMARLGNPQDRLPMVHVAGTNGKGSTVAMLSAVFKAAGYTVGTFISPHLVTVRERIQLNGHPIPEADFARHVAQLRAMIDPLPPEDRPTYFEFLNALAYVYFQEQGCDVTVFETGLGGRLDSTNCVKKPTLTVITGIDYDHMERLGPTLSHIAAEKAGIIKPGVPLVLGPNIPPEALSVILDRAKAMPVPVLQAPANRYQDQGIHQHLRHVRDAIGGTVYTLPLLGRYQVQNLATVLTALSTLRELGWPLFPQAIEAGLAQTVWPARFQVLPEQRLIIDGSHNRQGFESLAEALQEAFPGRRVICLASLRANRSIDIFIDPLAPHINHLLWTTGPGPYHPPDVLVQATQDAFTRVEAVEPACALPRLQALLAEDPDAVGLMTGSLYTAGVFLQQLTLEL